MGQGVSCASSSFEHDFFSAVQAGKLEVVDCFLRGDPALAHRTTIYDRLSALHIAAANGCLEVRSSPPPRCFRPVQRFLFLIRVCLQVLSMLLARSVSPDAVNRDKQVGKCIISGFPVFLKMVSGDFDLFGSSCKIRPH